MKKRAVNIEHVVGILRRLGDDTGSVFFRDVAALVEVYGESIPDDCGVYADLSGRLYLGPKSTKSGGAA